jgi:RNA polymerase sigma-32 factor
MSDYFLPIDPSAAALSRYMNMAYNAPILTVQQESLFAGQFQKNQDTEAAKQLVLSHLRFVIHIAKRYQNFGINLSDLIQEGTVGLMKAIHKFNPEIGARLASFAVHWIKSAIHDYILKNWRLVKIATTKSQRKLFFNLHKFLTTGNSLSSKDIEFVATTLAVDKKDVLEMEARLRTGHEYSISEQAEDDTFTEISIASEPSSQPESLVESIDYLNKRDAVLNAAIATLDARSQDIIHQRYFVEKKMKLNDLAKRYDISSERVRQLEKQAFNKLKSILSKTKIIDAKLLLPAEI